MKIEFDPAKNEANRIKHGVDMAQAAQFDWDTATVMRDERVDYKETRYTAQGYIGARLHILVFTLRGACVRVISLRKSNARERKSYEENR